MFTLPPNMPADRAGRFRTSVANHLRSGLAKGKPEVEIIAAQIAEQVALAKALAAPEFIEQATAAYARELANLHGNASLAESRRELVSILNNRILDCKNFIRLLADDSFIAAIRAEAAGPAPVAKPYQLSAAKIEETVRRLVQPNDPDGPEPAVHVAAGARGQVLTHEALANFFKPENGPLRPILVHALAQAWPQAPAGEVEHMAESWLNARHGPAFTITAAMKPGGVIYAEAMRQAELLQQQKLTAAAEASAAIEKAKLSSQIVRAPSPVTTAPREPQGKLAATPDLMVDAI